MNTVAHAVSTEPPRAVLNSQRCHFRFADGRRCRMRLSNSHSTLCVTHAEAEAESETSAHNFAIDLAPPSCEFRTATEVNHALGKVFVLLAQNRIPRRNAVALGYIAQLLLQTLPAVKAEQISSNYQAWRETLDPTPEDDDPGDEIERDEEMESDEGETHSDEEFEFRNESSLEDEANAAQVKHSAKTATNREPSLGAPISRLASFSTTKASATANTHKIAAVTQGNAAVARVFPPHFGGRPEAFPQGTAASKTSSAAPNRKRAEEPSLATPISALASFPDRAAPTQIVAAHSTNDLTSTESIFDPDDHPEVIEVAAQPPAKWCYRDPRGNPTVTGQVQLTPL